MNKLSSWSIRNPIPTLVLFIILTVGGVAGYDAMKISNMPDIDLPAVTVAVMQPGATPTELESQVTRIVEDAVAGLGSVKHVYSTVNEGVSVTTIEFELGVDVDRMTNDVRNAVTSVRSSLPADVEEPTVQRIDMSGGQVVTFVVRAPAMPPEEVSWFVDNDVSKALLAIEGVSQVERQGGVDREIRVRLDPNRLESLGITAGGISQQLRRINVNLPGGRTEIGSSEQAVRTVGSAVSVEALAATQIDLNDGRRVRLSDLGVVEDSWAEPRSRSRLNGEEVVSFGIIRTRGASEVTVAEQVREEIAILDASREDVEIEEISSTVDFVISGYYASIEALLFGALLAVAVVYWFLRDTRATFVSAIAMPLSLIPTFLVMALLGHSFNIVSLLALSLTVGVLVDDAIVEVENIVRHMREGKSAYRAAVEAVDEIGLAVIATSLTIVAVFAPVAFMPGIVGQFFLSFAIAACASVSFSLLVARTLTPLMAAYILKPDNNVEHAEPGWIAPYLRLLSWALDNRKTVLGAGVVIFVLSLGLTVVLPMDFVPAGDRERSVISVELAPGSTLAETDAAAEAVSKILRERPEVTLVSSAVGTAVTQTGPGGGGTAQGEVRRATVTANLVPRGDRDLTQQEFEAEIGKVLRRVPGVRVSFGADGQGASLQITLVADDPVLLTATARQLEREMRGIPGLVNVASKASLARPEIIITPKPDKAAGLGVSAETIAQAARVATLGDVDVNLPKFNLPDRQIPIRLMLVEESRADLSVIANLRVPAQGGQSIPLSSVADISFGAGPSQINRRDRRRSVTIEGELSGVTLGEANDAVLALPAMKALPQGVLSAPAGDVENMRELASGFGFAIAAGILLMYIVLTVLFGNFAHPLTILTALPLSIGGAFGLLLITGKSLSIPALIGILMLMGIAAKNSILLVEYAIRAQARDGMNRRDALMTAARKRARPIIMTTVAMSTGMFPVAFGFGADSEFRSPMAMAVIGGLITSTLLSLVFVPAAFTLIDDGQIWLKRRFGKWFSADKSDMPARALTADAPSEG